MNMFKSFFECLPHDRDKFVNDMKPEEFYLPPYTPDEIDDDLSLSVRSDSFSSILDDEVVNVRRGSASTDSSIPLSRAMTDSDVDYEEYYRRIKSRTMIDPYVQLKTVNDRFPSEYLDSMQSFQTVDTEIKDDFNEVKETSQPFHDEFLKERMERFFEEECCVFEPDDPGLEDLEKALDSLDLENLNIDSTI